MLKYLPTRDDVDALVGPATPHFAYQLRARLRELVAGLPESNDVRRYAEEKMELLDRLGHASSKAEEGQRESPSRPRPRPRSCARPAPSRCSCAATSRRTACWPRWRRSGRSTCSCTTPPRASC